MEQVSNSEEKPKLRKLIKRRLKAAKKYLAKCEIQLIKALAWQKEHHLAELLQAHLYLVKKGMHEIQIPDWQNEGELATINLDPSLKPSDEVAKRFRIAKKLRLSQEPLQIQLKRANEALISIEQQLRELEETESLDLFKEKHDLYPQVKKSKQNTLNPEPLPYYEFFSSSNTPIWVGKNARGNDAMTFRYANGNDYWLHIADYPGSHVVIHAREVDEETLQDALQLAIYYSKGKGSGKAEVTVAQKKHVSKLGHKPGKVQVSKHKTVLATLDLERIQSIKKRDALKN